MNYVSFPGFGISPFAVDPVAFKVFGLNVMWYGVIITCGMLLAYLYGLTRAKVEKVKSEDITDLTLFMVIFGVIGARLYYVIFKFSDFIAKDESGSTDIGKTLLNMINLRNGGLAIYGGIIAGFVTLLVVARVKRISFPVLLDIVAPCLFIGQAIGRWGNFVNVEAYGSTTDLPWRMGVGTAGGAPFVHPTFLYESLWTLVGFILIAIFYKKKKFHGQVFLFYGIWYGLGRAWIEGLRTDSLMLGTLRVSQILSIVIVVACAVLMAVGMKKAPRVSLADGPSSPDDGATESDNNDTSDAETSYESDEGETDAASESIKDELGQTGSEEAPLSEENGSEDAGSAAAEPEDTAEEDSVSADEGETDDPDDNAVAESDDTESEEKDNGEDN